MNRGGPCRWVYRVSPECVSEGASRDRFPSGRVNSPERSHPRGGRQTGRPFNGDGKTSNSAAFGPGTLSLSLLVARPLLARENGKPSQRSFVHQHPAETPA